MTPASDEAGAKGTSGGKGKRRTPRRPRSIEVTCRGASNSMYVGRTVDLSRGGVQVEFEAGRWTVPVDAEALEAFTEILRGHLPDGFEVSFGQGVVRARATIVRVLPVARPGGLLRVGLRFDPEISMDDAQRLGLGMSGDEESPRAAAAAWAPAPPSCINVRLAPTRTPQHPSAAPTVGRLVDVHAHGLTIEFTGRVPSDLPGWLRRLDTEVRLQCVSGTRVLWASMASVSKSSASEDGSFRVLLLARELPPAVVRSTVEPRAAASR